MTCPIFMMAQLTQDWFKGGWSATWESTGGPQQFSGGGAPFCPEAEPLQPGSTVDADVMTQMMFSYLAAGFKGFGFWCWTARTVGWEAGEFALTDRQGRPCKRTRQVGQIAQAARNLRDELWTAKKEPMVGIYVDFDNEATWAAMSVPGREHYKRKPMKARIGAVGPSSTPTFLGVRDGNGYPQRAGRGYQRNLPARTIAISSDVMETLSEFVHQGGRLVIDMPGAYYDEFGRLLSTDSGTVFERTFGCMIRNYQYTRNVPRMLDGQDVGGFVVDLGLTSTGGDGASPQRSARRHGEPLRGRLGGDPGLRSFLAGLTRATRGPSRTTSSGTHWGSFGCPSAR